MYPHRELAELAERKRILQARITVRRWECAAAATELARPLAFIDRGLQAWQRVAPFAKAMGVPLGFFLTRLLAGKRRGGAARGTRGKLGLLLSLLPMIVRGAKVVRAVRAAHAATKNGAHPVRAEAGRR